MSVRCRLRDLGVVIGDLPTGVFNAITDVPGVAVGHTTLIYDAPRVARTGVTVVLPRPRDTLYTVRSHAGFFSFNGNGEMTGTHWIAESGLLGGAVAITNTHQVGVVRDALVAHETQTEPATLWCLPVVAETYDGWLNDIAAFHLRAEHVFAALAGATAGPVAEGSVGGGTGMICHGFKGGIGTSSRLVEIAGRPYTIGVLVQANYGKMEQLRVAGQPVGRTLAATWSGAQPTVPLSGGSSIIVIIATDAPLLPDQCQRLARRATVGLARVGGTGHNGSGDIFLAFSTGNAVPAQPEGPFAVQAMPAALMNSLFDATADAVEESILNALCAAATMTGYQGRTVYGLPLEQLNLAPAAQ